MRFALVIADRGRARSIWIVVMFLACTIGLAAPNANAEESIGQIAPVHLTLPPTNMALGPILDVNLLPDGRVAAIGYVSDSRDTYIRIFDPRTGADEIFDEPVEGGLQPVEGMDHSIAVAGGSVFIYGMKARLLRASSTVVAGEGATDLNRLQGYDLAGMKRTSGAMVSYRESVLIGWWEGAYAKLRTGDCGNGAVVARVASDGRELWRWQDSRGGFGSPNDIVAFADGAVLVRVDRGYGRERPWEIAEHCFVNTTEIVALASDGHEIGRFDLSPFLCVGPLSQSADGQEAIAIAQTDDAPYAILRIRIEDGRIHLQRLDLPEKIPDIGCQSNAATMTLQGGYRIAASYDGLLTLDSQGHPLAWEPFPVDETMECRGHGDQGVICWKGDQIAILPLSAASPPDPQTITWRIQAPGIETGSYDDQVQRIERLPDGRFAVLGRISPAADNFLQIVDPDDDGDWSVGLHDEGGLDIVNRPSHAVAMTKDAIFVAQSFGSLWRVSTVDHEDRLLKPVGLSQELWWNGVLPVDDDIYGIGWEGDDDPGSCGKGTRVARLSSEGGLVWSWQDSLSGFRFPADMVLLDGGSLLVLINGEPPPELFGEDMASCDQGLPDQLVLIGANGRELDRMALPKDLRLGLLSQNSRKEAVALALRDGLEPDMVMTISVVEKHITLSQTPIRTPLHVDKSWGIATTTADGYRLLLPSQILTLDRQGLVIAKQRQSNAGRRCQIVAGQGEFCWTADQIRFQTLQ